MTKQRDGYSVTYADSNYIYSEINKVFSSLANENYLQGTDAKQFAARLTYYYVELDSIHPFREGNSRTLRELTADLAAQAGYKLDLSLMAKNERSRKHLYFARDIAVINADLSHFTKIIEDSISPNKTK